MSDYHMNGWSDELDRQDRMKSPEQCNKRRLAFRCGWMIRHIAAHNSFDKADLIQLLKDVKRELEKESDNE